MIGSCGHETEETYTVYSIYHNITEQGWVTGVMNGNECKECFDKAIESGDGYTTWEEVWNKLMEVEDE